MKEVTKIRNNWDNDEPPTELEIQIMLEKAMERGEF